MDIPSFVPKRAATDLVSAYLLSISRGILLVCIAILPLLFVPGLLGLTASVKIYAVFAAVVAATIFASLGILRGGHVTLRPAPLLLAWWAVALAAAVAALFAPQTSVAFWGDSLEIHTVGFLLLSAVLMTLMQLFRDSRSAVVYLYSGLFGSALVISLLHLFRLVFGPDVFSFGLLASPAATLVGGFNDLGLFLALAVMVGLITLAQLRLPKLVSQATAGIIVVALVMLAIINFFMVWVVIGLFSLTLLMYTLTKGRFATSTPGATSSPSIILTLLTALVFVVSVVFVVGGPSLGGAISQMSGISYLEVRPSASATLDVLRQVFAEDAFTGAGPNHFGEAWTQFKDGSINNTVFWNTTFNAGNGYVPTWFVTTGILGVFTWLTFLGLFLWSGVQALLRSTVTDNFWYFIASISFVSGLFVWGMAIVYVPGPVMLILGVVSTGIFLVAYQALLPREVATINLLASARTGFVLIVAVMLVIIGSIGVGYRGFQQFAAMATYASALTIAPGDNRVVEVTATVGKAYNSHASDVFARELALYQFTELRAITALPEPTKADTDRFTQLVAAAIESSNAAINVRGSDARNWSLRGDIYALLAGVKIEGAKERALLDYAEAEKRDPNNPYYELQKAIIALSDNAQDEARTHIAAALARKVNYTDALLLLSQLDIANGKIDEAIKTTESLIAIESNNPGRYYQLGVLYSAKKDSRTAIDAFSRAIVLNPQYANARYLRALELVVVGEKDAALAELRIVKELNPDNSIVDDLIGKIERGEVNATTLTSAQAPVAEPESVTTTEEVVTTNEDPKSDLVTPVNTVPATASTTTAE
jgi:tetratricopeptide (TPR) repeat protein